MGVGVGDGGSNFKIILESTISSANNKFNTIDIYRIFCPRAEEYTCFSAAPKTFIKVDHILGNDTHLNHHYLKPEALDAALCHSPILIRYLPSCLPSALEAILCGQLGVNEPFL